MQDIRGGGVLSYYLPQGANLLLCFPYMSKRDISYPFLSAAKKPPLKVYINTVYIIPQISQKVNTIHAKKLLFFLHATHFCKIIGKTVYIVFDDIIKMNRTYFQPAEFSRDIYGKSAVGRKLVYFCACSECAIA